MGKTRGHTVRGPPEKRRPDGRRARGRFVRRQGEWFSLSGRTAGQCVSSQPPRGRAWASPPVARPARPPAMDRVAAPRAPEAEPSPTDAPAASGASALRVTAQTFTPAASATERVPAPRAPEAEPSPHVASAATGSSTLRATARTFMPGRRPDPAPRGGGGGHSSAPEGTERRPVAMVPPDSGAAPRAAAAAHTLAANAPADVMVYASPPAARLPASNSVPAPRTPEAEPRPHNALAASGSSTLRATARTFTPGQGARDEDVSLSSPPRDGGRPRCDVAARRGGGAQT